VKQWRKVTGPKRHLPLFGGKFLSFFSQFFFTNHLIFRLHTSLNDVFSSYSFFIVFHILIRHSFDSGCVYMVRILSGLGPLLFFTSTNLIGPENMTILVPPCMPMPHPPPCWVELNIHDFSDDGKELDR
jgi:hypothetical protein